MSASDTKDFLIVGQGLAGTVLASLLEKKGCSFSIIDKLNPNSSSRVAAGLVNPITGRRIVKTWKADEIIPFAQKYYSEYESTFSTNFFHTIDAVEQTSSIHEWNEWNRRMDEQEMSHYFHPDSPNESYREKIKDFIKLVRITSSGWLDLSTFLTLFRNKWIKENLLHEENFTFSELKHTDEGISYKGEAFKKIIFCEGYKCAESIYWNWIPMIPAKGEIAVIECKELPEDFILLSGMFFIPLGNHRFRCGATYEWNFTDELPSELGKQKLIKMIGEVIKIDWKLISHTAGIRPTVKDRRPILGAHSEHKNIFIFNGMGTKGVMLAPYFADQLVNHLLEGKLIDPDVDVARFYK